MINMNLQRVSAVFRKEILRIFKDPAVLFMIVIFPIIITATFAYSFGKFETNSGSQIYTIAFVNNDESGLYPEWAAQFRGNLSKNEILVIEDYATNESAQIDLQNGKITGIVIVPARFGESVESYRLNPFDSTKWINVSVELFFDQSNLVATQTLRPVIQQVILTTMYGEAAMNTPLPISIGTPSLVDAKFISQFDYMAPGLFAFAAIFSIMLVAQSIVTEREKGLLRRMYLTPVTSAEIMTGETLANMSSGILQMISIFLVAIAIGYRPNVSFEVILFALLIEIIFTMSCVGFGLIVGAVSKNEGMATGLSFVVLIPQMFLGTFVMFGEPTFINYIVPSFYVTDALKNLLLRGAPITSSTVILDLIAVMIYSIIVFLIGILAFKKFGKK